MPVNLKQMLEILSPVRPRALRMASGLGDVAATLRGGTQPVGQLLNQLRGKPGVKPGAMSQVFGHIPNETRLSPLELASQARSPRLFAQRGITDSNPPDNDMVMEIADDIAWGPEFREKRSKLFIEELLTMANQGAVDKDMARQLIGQYMANPSVFERDVVNVIDNYGIGVHEIFSERGLMDDALSIAEENMPGDLGKTMEPAYDDYQRQPYLNEYDSKYFETVLRGTPSRARSNAPNSFHFTNPSQFGHVRGSIVPDGRVFAEELQSDPLEVYPGEPALQDIYGKLGRMLIDRSAEAGAPSVSFPDANRIAAVRRPGQLPFFQSVYDKDLAKQLYEPLAKRGVPLRQENGWTTMDLPEGVLEAIRTRGLLNYAGGGLVKGALSLFKDARFAPSLEDLHNKNKGNGAVYAGKPFWSGTVDMRDKKINEVHNFEKAADSDFHHSFYVSPGQQEAMSNGEAAFFWVDPGRQPQLQWREKLPRRIEEELRRAIEQQTVPTASRLNR